MKNRNQTKIYAFIDWNSQIHSARKWRSSDPNAEDVLEHVAKKIERGLKSVAKNRRFSINMRLYSGWHKGFEKTKRRKDLMKISPDDVHQLSRGNLAFIDISFGDTALGGLSKRIVKGTNSHFPGTCRDRGNGDFEEKMVDTALVSDLIYCAASDEDDSWLLVLGEDIDLMPGVYTAESFLDGDRKIAYLRTTNEPYLQCKDLYSFDGEAAT